MSEKKKLIRIQGLSGGGTAYTISSMNFAFVSSPADGRKQACAIMTCREYVNRVVAAAFNKRNVSHYKHGVYPAMDFTALRLLVVYDADNLEDFKRKLFNGKAALNLFEDMAGWKRSTITTVVHSNYKNAWLLTGPKEWISQPQLLSLATWVMRLASFAGPLDVSSYDALEKSFYDIQKKGLSEKSDSTVYCRRFWNKSYILVKYAKEIFEGMSMKDAWESDNYGDFGVYSGFLTFCDEEARYNSKVRAAQKRFQRLCGKYLPRKNNLIERR